MGTWGWIAACLTSIAVGALIGAFVRRDLHAEERGDAHLENRRHAEYGESDPPGDPVLPPGAPWQAG